MTSDVETHPVLRVRADGARTRDQRVLAVEAPVAIEVNGIAYAVMMATPCDLEDFVTGFLASERLLDSDLLPGEIAIHAASSGVVARVAVAAVSGDRLLARVRHRTTDSACGLCGIESLEASMLPVPRVRAPLHAAPAAVFRARAALAAHQPLHAATGAAHAAALCDPEGAIRLVREDVGRHNAMDKLIGAMRRAALGWDGGFALVSSRCSYELVEKAALAGCPMLAAISAPTALAAERARGAGMALAVLARDDSLLWLDPE